MYVVVIVVVVVVQAVEVVVVVVVVVAPRQRRIPWIAELVRHLTKLKTDSIESLDEYKSSIDEKQAQLAKDVANQDSEVGKQKKLKSRQKAMQVIIEETLPSQCTATNSYQKVVDRAIRFAKLCGETNINVLNREDMDEWLLPTVVPIATLVQTVLGDSTSS